jgi:hypothetical protein
MDSTGSSLPLQEDQFDIFEWYPDFQSCLRYFLEHAQYDGSVQALAAFLNIHLPHQKQQLAASATHGGAHSAAHSQSSRAASKLPMSSSQPCHTGMLLPYIRRLVATGFDFPGMLHGMFGDKWAEGIGPLHKVERRNYLFAAKSASWSEVKAQYDMPDGQGIPFLKPLQNVTEIEIVEAEAHWSHWLQMQDWMLGPRALEAPREPSVVVKMEES